MHGTKGYVYARNKFMRKHLTLGYTIPVGKITRTTMVCMQGS